MRWIPITLTVAAILLLALSLHRLEPAAHGPSDANSARPADSPTTVASTPTRPPPQEPALHPPSSNTRTQSTHRFDKIEQALRRDAYGLTQETNPDGSQSIDLGGRYQSGSMARRLPDGSLEVRCFESFNAAKEFLINEPEHPTRNTTAPMPTLATR